jgi:hypothetical protein
MSDVMFSISLIALGYVIGMIVHDRLNRRTYERSDVCLLCERPLPKLSWWDRFGGFLLEPPPVCMKDHDECFRIFYERFVTKD